MHSPWTGDKTPGKSVSKKEMKNFDDTLKLVAKQFNTEISNTLQT